MVVDTSIGGHRMARELDNLIARRGRPHTIVSDNGTEMTSRAMLEWTNRTPTALAPEVCGFGTWGVTPSVSQARISSPEKALSFETYFEGQAN